MTARETKSLEAARDEISQAAAALNRAADLLRPHRALFAQFKVSNAPHGPTAEALDPSERRATGALLGPTFSQAEIFLRVFDAQKDRARAALVAVKGGKAL